jgi:hypothetical protein
MMRSRGWSGIWRSEPAGPLRLTTGHASAPAGADHTMARRSSARAATEPAAVSARRHRAGETNRQRRPPPPRPLCNRHACVARVRTSLTSPSHNRSTTAQPKVQAGFKAYPRALGADNPPAMSSHDRGYTNTVRMPRGSPADMDLSGTEHGRRLRHVCALSHNQRWQWRPTEASSKPAAPHMHPQRLAQPSASAARHREIRHPCGNFVKMELAGLEPATSWVRSRRSPN